MRIEADLFSGRPNPAWVPSPAEAREVSALLAGLEASARPADEFDGLGYRGMRVMEVEPPVHGCTEFRVAHGVALAQGAEGPRTFSDPGRALERRLIALCEAHLPPDLHAVLRTFSGIGEAG